MSLLQAMERHLRHLEVVESLMRNGWEYPAAAAAAGLVSTLRNAGTGSVTIVPIRQAEDGCAAVEVLESASDLLLDEGVA